MTKKVANTGGVYSIRNTKNGWIYIGASATINERWRSHSMLLCSGKHHNPRLQADWNSFGPTAFVFDVVEDVADLHALPDREVFWIEEHGRSGTIYNATLRSNGLKASISDRTQLRLDDQAKDDAALIAEEYGLGSTSAAVRYALREVAKRIKRRKPSPSRPTAPAVDDKEERG